MSVVYPAFVSTLGSDPEDWSTIGHPIIPVGLRFDEGRGKWFKLPCVSWKLATTDAGQIAEWRRQWPEALPAIPLRYADLVVVDADRREGIDGVAAVTGIGPLGPHSRVSTPSGGVHLVFAQPDPPITSRFRWADGVEVLGSSSLLTCYDLEELAFPRVAPRAKLPKMFWQARDGSADETNGTPR